MNANVETVVVVALKKVRAIGVVVISKIYMISIALSHLKRKCNEVCRCLGDLLINTKNSIY